MSFLLTNEFDDSFKFKEEIYNINLNFDNVLRLFEMFDDEDFNQIEKPIIALEMLIREELPSFDSYDQAIKLFMYVMKEFLDIDLEENEKKIDEDKDLEGNDQKPQKIFDYKKDAEIIYASFLHVYRIDLFDMQGKLHWKKFNALLSHLSDDSKFKQVIGYRQMKVPNMKEASSEYINHVRKMKEVYSLDERSAEEKFNATFNTLSKVLKGK